MDSLITAAARALAAGDPVAALKRVALREDAPALALRGIAMAQLGDLPRAKDLLKRAGRAFGAREAVARARCVVAEAEIALVSRDLSWPTKALDAARKALEARGDLVNAAHARTLEARRLLLIGRLDEAERALGSLDAAALPAAARAAFELVSAGVAIRRLKMKAAHAALARADRAAREADIPALAAEIEHAAAAMKAPAARIVARGQSRVLLLDQVEALFASDALIIDACRHVVRARAKIVPLAKRPVLFELVRALGEAWPDGAARATLLARAFRAKHADESHRARLRVEIGRLRKALAGVAEVSATERGFVLTPRRKGEDIVVLAPPSDETNGEVLALLADGEAWASSALALALAQSARTVQRALDELAAQGKVQALGKGRAQRWIAPPAIGFPTSLLLPGPLPGG